MDSDERTKPLTGRKLRDRKGSIHTWMLSVLFTTVRGGRDLGGMVESRGGGGGFRASPWL